MDNIVEMYGISKAFGSNQANKDIDFICRKGEVICLLGENGAGKSTLMKILYGQYHPDTGNIIIKGEKVHFSGAKDAIKLGIQMVHQHFMLVPVLSAVDNVMIGKEVGKKGRYDRRKAAKVVQELSRSYGLEISGEKLVRDLSVGEQQRVEIIKALYHGADVLILDEPTAVLTHQEIEELFDIIRSLRDKGKTIILITHKLKETMEISDRVYVMRNGRMVASCRTADTNVGELGCMMVGRQIQKPVKQEYPSESSVLYMENVTLKNKYGYPVLNQVNLDIKDHEILGIAGVEGNGQMELIDVLMALNKGWKGKIELEGEPIKGKSTEELLNLGVSCVYADRQEDSIVMDLDVSHNMLMGYQSNARFLRKRYLLDWKKIKSTAVELMEKYDVRPRDVERKLSEFSGGNQQKFVVGRELERNPRLMIAAHPTRGVDIMATAFIHEHLNQLKAAGAGILLISSDMDELMELSDRIAIIYDGAIVSCRKSEEYSAAEIGSLMGGGIKNEKNHKKDIML